MHTSHLKMTLKSVEIEGRIVDLLTRAALDTYLPFPADIQEWIARNFLSLHDLLSLDGISCDLDEHLAPSMHITHVTKFEEVHVNLTLFSGHFLSDFLGVLYRFRTPHKSTGSQTISTTDGVAYASTVIDTRKLLASPSMVGVDPLRNGVYVEMDTWDVRTLVSLSLVDFDGHGRSSVTFNPQTGTIIREHRLTPFSSNIKIVKGEYCHVLPAFDTLPSTETISMAVFLSIDGNITFFRKRATFNSWDSTGHVSHCNEFDSGEGLITPCVAFEAAGLYNVQIKKFQTVLPYYVDRPEPPPTEMQWSSLLWGAASPGVLRPPSE